MTKDSSEYLPWGGWFAHPTLEPEVCSRHPGWWQRERAFIRKAVREGREFSLDEILKLREGDPAQTLAVHISSGISLDYLKSRFKTTATAEAVLVKLRAVVNADYVLARCTAFGDGRDLLREKPLQGLFAYIWISALYQKDVIPIVPIYALFDLEDGIFDLTGEWVSVGEESVVLHLWLDSQIKMLMQQVH